MAAHHWLIVCDRFGVQKGVIDCSLNYFLPIVKLYWNFYSKKIHVDGVLGQTNTGCCCLPSMAEMKELKADVNKAIDPNEYTYKSQPISEVSTWHASRIERVKVYSV